MPNAIDLVKAVKRASVEAVEATKPTAVLFGKVTSTSPIQINVEQKMTLGAAQLIFCGSVTEHKTMITGGEKIQVTVHNGLVVGDTVLLIRQQGGQKYIVVDRVG